MQLPRGDLTVTIAFGLIVACLAGFLLTQQMTTGNWLIAGGLLVACLLLLLVPGPSGENTSAPSASAARPGGSASPDSTALLATIGAALPDPVLVLDSDGIVIFCNDHARTLFERDPTGRHVSVAIRAPAILEGITEATGPHRPSVVDYEIRVPVERRFEAHITPLRPDRPGAPDQPGRAAVALVLHDLSRAYHVERMRADFIANASHELRTPLSSMLGFIETLQGPARDDEAARTRFLALMHQQGTRMARLIDDLLSLSRIEMNAHVQPTASVDVTETVRHVVELMQPLAADRQVGLAVAADPDASCRVRGDRDELVQVFQNLIENAIKYAGDARRVDITIGRAGQSVEVSVRDYGPGIGEEHLPRLTERFYRVSTQDSRDRGGTGLGLAIVKHILNRHRGRLVIRSRLGEGSIFTVRLPVSESD